MTQTKKTFLKGVLHFSPLIFIIVAITLFYSRIPSEKEIRGCLITKMRKVHLCPGGRDYVKLRSISNSLRNTILLTEDGSFYQHDGFDWEELENAVKKNLETGSYTRGASTISQQLAKNMFLTEEKSLLRKAWEALFTIKIENTLTKNEIFERYLNVVQFGPDIYGVKEASAFYFKKSPGELNLVESIFLAFVLPNPDKYSRSYFKKELTPYAQKRMVFILEKLRTYNRISEEDYLEARERLPHFPYHNMPLEPPAESTQVSDLPIGPDVS